MARIPDFYRDLLTGALAGVGGLVAIRLWCHAVLWLARVLGVA